MQGEGWLRGQASWLGLKHHGEQIGKGAQHRPLAPGPPQGRRVSPLALVERGALALMALPLGLIAGVITARTRCLWGAVLLHLLLNPERHR